MPTFRKRSIVYVMALVNLFSMHARAFISKNLNNDCIRRNTRSYYSLQRGCTYSTRILPHRKVSSSFSSLRSTTSQSDPESSSYWERLSKPKTVMAPMVAQSDLPFRHLCRKYDTDLCYTQMIHATNFIASELFQDAHLDLYRYGEAIAMSPSGLNALKGLGDSDSGFDDYDWMARFQDQQDEMKHLLSSLNGGPDGKKGLVEQWSTYREGEGNVNPLIVQLAGHDPKTMSDAAQIILKRTNERNDNDNGVYSGPVNGIDINCGCPQGIARKGRYGAFLMEESVDIVCDIVSTLRHDLPGNIGISCKIRIPENVGTPNGDAVLKERICKLIDAGVQLITVHGRTVKENKTKVRECNWDAIAKAVTIAREYSGDEEFPIISNGGIEFSSDVSRCLEATGASAVMSSEALLENPGLFLTGAKDDIDLSPKEVFERQIRFCHEYLDYCSLYPPLPASLGKVGGSFSCIKTHIFKLLYRYFEEHPDLCKDLGQPDKVKTIQQARGLILDLERRYSKIDTNNGWDNLISSDTQKKSWYRRHRDAITSSKMRTRGQKVQSELHGLSIEQRKEVMRKRLKKMKEERESNSKMYV